MEIGVWGDSITYGEGDEDILGWVGRLQRSFTPDSGVSIYNRGVCGDTTVDLLKRFKIEAESIEPTKILFAIGINDSKIPENQETNLVYLPDFEKNVKELIRQAKIITNSIYIIGLTNVDEKGLVSASRFLNGEIQRYNRSLEEIANAERLLFINVFDVLNPSDYIDGLHPNSRGYSKLAEVIGDKL